MSYYIIALHRTLQTSTNNFQSWQQISRFLNFLKRISSSPVFSESALRGCSSGHTMMYVLSIDISILRHKASFTHRAEQQIPLARKQWQADRSCPLQFSCIHSSCSYLCLGTDDLPDAILIYTTKKGKFYCSMQVHSISVLVVTEDSSVLGDG